MVEEGYLRHDAMGVPEGKVMLSLQAVDGGEGKVVYGRRDETGWFIGKAGRRGDTGKMFRVSGGQEKKYERESKTCV